MKKLTALQLAFFFNDNPSNKNPGVEGPLLRPATSSMLLTTRSRSAKKETTPHPFYGRRLLTQRLLNQREREASIKPTATIGVNKVRDDLAGDRQSRTLYLNDTRTVREGRTVHSQEHSREFLLN